MILIFLFTKQLKKYCDNQILTIRNFSCVIDCTNIRLIKRYLINMHLIISKSCIKVCNNDFVGQTFHVYTLKHKIHYNNLTKHVADKLYNTPKLILNFNYDVP